MGCCRRRQHLEWLYWFNKVDAGFYVDHISSAVVAGGVSPHQIVLAACGAHVHRVYKGVNGRNHGFENDRAWTWGVVVTMLAVQ